MVSEVARNHIAEPLQAASYQQEAGVLKLDNKRAQEDIQRLQEHIWTIGGPSEAEQPCCVDPSVQWCRLRTWTVCMPPILTSHCSGVHLSTGQLPSTQGQLVHAMWV